MQWILALCLFGSLVLTGCNGTPAKQAPARTSARTIKVSVDTNSVSNPRQVTFAADALDGRVVTVNKALRFVVVDFANQKLPQLDQKLSVYHFDQKVAEIKVSGPYLGTTVAADITAGDASPGDLVRNER